MLNVFELLVPQHTVSVAAMENADFAESDRKI